MAIGHVINVLSCLYMFSRVFDAWFVWSGEDLSRFEYKNAINSSENKYMPAKDRHLNK